jgi:alkylhydroperoxidase family enzyme
MEVGTLARRLLAPNRTRDKSPVSAKLRALLAIADKVRLGGRRVTEEEVERARSEGADDKAIHDAVLIAAAFCMFNRYVDGLATWAPREQSAYEKIGADLACRGYLNSIPT